MTLSTINSVGSIKETPFATTDGGYGTSLPASPTDGMEYTLVDSVSAPTYAWRLRYNASNSGSYKWDFVGGSPQVHRVETDETTTNAAYVDLATTGPTLTTPRTGIYEITIGSQHYATAGVPQSVLTSVSFAGAAAVDADAMQDYITTNSQAWGAHSRSYRRTLTSATVTKMQYRVGAGLTGSFRYRWMTITPVQIS